MARPSVAARGQTSLDQAAGEPGALRDLRPRAWWKVLKRTLREFREDNLMDWAAALTYYAMLAFFPSLLALVALVGLVGQYPETSDAVLRIVGRVAPSSSVEAVRGPIEGVIRSKGGAGALLGLGLLVALWSASGYIGAFTRATNAIYGVREGRSFWKRRPVQLAGTVGLLVLVTLVALALVLTGPLAEAVGKELGLGDAGVTVWSVAKWPLLLAIVTMLVTTLYYAAPDVRQPGIRWLAPGGLVAVLLWVAASAGFTVYVSHFGDYNKTYGTLGGAIAFLVWLWITNLAILLGAELNSELARERGPELRES